MENGGEAKEVDWDEVKSIFKGLDKDGDKSVEWEEFFVRIFYALLDSKHPPGCSSSRNQLINNTKLIIMQLVK